jgi:hypothetical protein
MIYLTARSDALMLTGPQNFIPCKEVMNTKQATTYPKGSLSHGLHYAQAYTLLRQERLLMPCFDSSTNEKA